MSFFKDIFGSLGTIPGIMAGKSPGEALFDNLKMAALVGTGMAAAPLLGAEAGAGLLGAETAAAGTGQAATGLLADGAYTGTASQLAADGLGGVSSFAEPSMWETAQGFMKQAKPFTDAAGTGMQVAKAMTPQEQPYQPVTSQMPQRQPQEFPFSQMPLQAITDDNERRKKMMQMFAQNTMRG